MPDSPSETDTSVLGNIPVEDFPLIILLWEFSETRILLLISFCLWEDLSINDFFLFTNASCKLPGTGINLGRVSVKTKMKAIFTSLNFFRPAIYKMVGLLLKCRSCDLSGEFPVAPGFTNNFRSQGIPVDNVVCFSTEGSDTAEKSEVSVSGARGINSLT